LTTSKKVIVSIDERLNRIETLLNSLAGAKSVQAPQPDKPMTMTTAQMPTTPKPESPTYSCSVCGLAYHTDGQNSTCGWIAPRVIISRYTNFGSPTRPLYRYDRFECAEKLSKAVAALTSDMAEPCPMNRGRITH